MSRKHIKTFFTHRQLEQPIFDHNNTSASDLHQLIALTFILEECIKLEAQSIKISQESFSFTRDSTTENVIVKNITFYSQPKIKTVHSKKSFPSFTNQIFSLSRTSNLTPTSNNFFSALLEDCTPEEYKMEIDTPTINDDSGCL